MNTNLNKYKVILKKIVFTFLIIVNVNFTKYYALDKAPKIATLIANNDDFSATTINGVSGGTPGNVLANDTSDGNSIDASKITIKIVLDGGLAGVTIAPNGTINVPAGTPSRTFRVTYEICENGDTPSCDSAQVTIFVDADSDEDGVLDSVDMCDNFDDTLDNDQDGIPDNCDDDDDDDGIKDVDEGCTAQVVSTYQKIYFADGTIDISAPTDETLVYSTDTNYVSLIDGADAPENLLFLNGFDPIGGQAKMVFDVTDPYILTVDESLVLRAYLFDNRRVTPNEEQYDLPLLATLNTISSGVLSVEQFLTDEQITDLDAGKWIEVEFKFEIPASLSGEIFINNITLEIEVNNSGEGPNFIESYSEVFGIIPLDLKSDAEAQSCNADRDCDGDSIPDYFDDSICNVDPDPDPDPNPDPNPDPEIIIPNTFTPNDDGVNDTFKIPALENNLEYKIEIYNRWGNKVYEYSRNGNTDSAVGWWNGYSNGRLTMNESKPLPVGTYYYIIDFNDGSTSRKQGWVYLNK